MNALVIDAICDLKNVRSPLKHTDLPVPTPGDREILVKVSACGVCHTELDEIEGRTPPPRFPVVPGHQVVGRVVERGPNAHGFEVGERVGIAWIYRACGTCDLCRDGNENLCEGFLATGRDADGGYAQYMKIREDFAVSIPKVFSDAEAAPLLCAGAIGYRSLSLTGMKDGENLGLTGFGASAHLVIKLAKHRYPSARIFVFARNENERVFARELGAVWAGDTDDAPPERLHAIIDTTPAWHPVVRALGALRNGGRLVINAIRKEDRDRDALLRIDYAKHLWMEKEIKSVANVTRKDVSEFLREAARLPIRPEVQAFPLKEANQALLELKEGKIRGAKVLQIE